jgi:hypothetical protein
MKKVLGATIGILLAFSTLAYSQSNYATVSGTVDDATGAVIPGVTMTAVNAATGVSATTLTNEAGAYNFASLLTGTYKVTAALSGFQTQSYTDVQLADAQRVRLNFTLKVGTVSAAVDVAIPVDTLLATSSSSIGQIFTNEIGSSGALARVLEGWQTSWIVNLSTGAPLSIAAANMLYANGTPDIVGPFSTNGKVVWGVPTGTGNLQGTYFPQGTYQLIRDPQCSNANVVAPSLQSNCTLNAVADAAGRVLLQNPLPGRKGTLGQYVLEGPGRWRFDANAQKSFNLGERRSLALRVDATNVFNHPGIGNPSVTIAASSTATTFGNIASKNADHRQFQGTLRLSF